LPAFYREYQARTAAARLSATDDSPETSARRSPAPVSWKRWLREWLISSDAKACGISLLFHALLLTTLSIVVVKHGGASGRPSGLSLLEGDSQSAGAGLENLMEGELESAGGGGEGLTSTTTILSASTDGPGSVEIQSPVRPEIDLQSTVAGLNQGTIDIGDPSDLTQQFDDTPGSGTGKGRGKGSGIGNLTDGFARPGGGRGVVKKGKFAAWTVPSDPRPRQDYLIVIEVEYPKTKETKLLRKRRNDLSGTVQGSDTYFQIIEKTGYFIPKSNQMVIPVPGAEMNVRDVIQVRSKVLEESQELTIVF
jgi:hypothetical protein